jgi:hypothetical protein
MISHQDGLNGVTRSSGIVAVKHFRQCRIIPITCEGGGVKGARVEMSEDLPVLPACPKCDTISPDAVVVSACRGCASNLKLSGIERPF